MYSSSSPGASRLLDRLRERIRYRHDSLRTEQAYLLWALYREVPGRELPWMHQIQRPAGTRRIAAGTVASPLDALRGAPEPA